MYRRTECPREFPISNRGGRRDVVNATRPLPIAIAIHDPENHPDHVVTIDPGHPLLAAAERSSGAETEREQHLAEGASVPAEDDAKAKNDHAGHVVGSVSELLPTAADVPPEA